MKSKKDGIWRNDAGNETARPQRQHWPESLADIVAVVREAEQIGARVRAVGSGHSWSDVALTTGWLINPDRLNRVLPVDGSLLKGNVDTRTLFQVESGISIRELNERLHAAGLALPNMGGYDAQTIVGAISTSTHGSGLQFGPMSDLVQSLELVAEGGIVYRIEPTEGITAPTAYGTRYADRRLIQRDDWFRAVVVSMGCMGVIYSVVLRVTQRFWLKELRWLNTWSRVKNDLKRGDVLRENRHYEVLLNPNPERDGDHRCLVTTRNVAGPADGRTMGERSRSFLDAVINSLPFVRRIAIKVLRFASMRLVELFRLIPELKPEVVNAALGGLVDKDGYTDISYKVFNIGIANEVPALSAEIGVPLANHQYLDAVDRLLAVAEEHRARHGWYHSAPVSLRFVKASSALLSMMHGRDSCMLEIIMAKGTEGTLQMLNRYEKELYVFDGRPHWGQVHSLSGRGTRMASLYREYDQWRDIYKQLNPNGTFDSVFTDRMGCR